SRGWGPAVRGDHSGRASRRTSRGWGSAVRGDHSGRASRRTSRGWGSAVRGDHSGRASRRTSRGWGPAVRGDHSKGEIHARVASEGARSRLRGAAGRRPSRCAAPGPGKGLPAAELVPRGLHTPFYYGKERGLYAAEGIDLTINEGRGSAN